MARARSDRPPVLVGRVAVDRASLPAGVLAPVVGVEVSDDPALLAWIRQAHEADLEARFTAALEAARASRLVDIDACAALRHRPERAAEELLRLMHDERLPAKSRVCAAGLLAELGRPEGNAFLLAALDETSPLCAASLELLGGYRRTLDPADAAVAARVVACLAAHDPAVVAMAARVCEFAAVPAAEAGLLTALRRASPGKPARSLAEALARCATTAASIEAALPHLLPEPTATHYNSQAWLFARTLAHPDPAVSGPLRRALRTHLLGYPDEVRLTQHWARDFAAVAEPGDEPLLEDLAARSTDVVSRAHAVEGLARLHPDRAVARALEQIRRDRPWDLLVRLLDAHATEADHDAIVAVLHPEGGPARRLEWREVRLFHEKLGERGRQRVALLRDRLEPFAREWLDWRERGLDARAALAELHAAGVIAATPDEILARMTEAARQRGVAPPDPTHPATLALALGWAGTTTTFDTETGFVPCHHDRLIEHFAAGSAGRFAPECPVQVWERSSSGDREPGYVVLFLHAGRAYRFRAENLGDYYDVPAVVGALNAALEQSGRPERYLGLYTGDQCARFVFADPACFVPVARRYGLPLEADPASGRNAGRAYERQVLGDAQ